MLEIESVEELSALVASTPLLLVDFYTTWCIPCRIAAKALATIERDLIENGFKLVKVDIDKVNADEIEKRLKLKEPIRHVPTIIIFKNGKEVTRIVGVKLRNDFHLELKEKLLSAVAGGD